jgi:hypothetical protein
VCAASQINVADPVAAVDQPLNGVICDIAAVTEVHVVKVLSQARDGVDGRVRDVAALGQDQVTKPGGKVDDPLHGTVCEAGAAGQIQDSEVLVDPVGGERQEGRVVDKIAVGEAQLAERLALGEQSRDGLVANVPARVEIDLEDVGALLGKGQDRPVVQLVTVVKFQLESGSQHCDYR